MKEEEKGFFEELRNRKVFREVKAYLFGGAAMIPLIWLVVSVLGYSDETTRLITKIVVVIFISFFPSVFLFAYYHGESKNTPWSKAEKIGIPLNLIVTFFVVFLFFNQDLAASDTTTVEIEDEFGNISTAEIVKPEHRKRALIFYFENKSENSAINWQPLAILQSCYVDLLQDQYISLLKVSSRGLQRLGFKYGDAVPFSKKLKTAREASVPFFITGSFEKSNEQFIVKVEMYDSKTGKSILEKEVQNKNLFALIDELTIDIKKGLGFTEKHINESVDLPVSDQLTSSIIALEYYSHAYLLAMEDKKGKERLALKLLNKAIKEDPYFAWAHYSCVQFYGSLNKMDSVDYALDKTMENIDRFPETESYSFKANYYSIKKMPDKAFKIIKNWVKKWPDDIKGHESLAYEYQQRGMFEDAIKEYEHILNIDPNEYNALYYLGYIYEKIDNYNKVIEYKKKYMNATSSSFEGCYLLAETFVKIGEFDSANVYCQQAQMLDPINFWPKLLSEKIEMKMGDYKTKEKEYYSLFQYCKSGSDSTNVILLFQELYTLEGKISKTQILRDSINRTFSTNTALEDAGNTIRNLDKLLDLGKIKEVMVVISNLEKEFDFSMDSLSKSIEQLQVASGQSTRNIDGLKLSTGKKIYMHESLQGPYKQGIKTYIDFAAKLGNVYGYANILMDEEFLLKAKLEMLNNNYENAISILEKNKNQSRELVYFLTLGRYHHHQKQYTEAEENFNIIFKRNPINPKGHYYAALLYYDWGKKEKAREYLNKALEVWKDADADYIFSNMAKATAQEWKIEILN